MGKLSFSKKNDGDIIVMNIGGVIDTAVAAELEKSMKDAIGDKLKIIGNLESLEHITSAGLGVLIAVNNELKGKGGELRLSNVTDKIRKVLDLMNLTKLIKVFPTVEDAKKSF